MITKSPPLSFTRKLLPLLSILISEARVISVSETGVREPERTVVENGSLGVFDLNHPGVNVADGFLFGENVDVFTDRNHAHSSSAFNSGTGLLSTTGDFTPGLPSYLLGHEYVTFANDGRDNNPYNFRIVADIPSTFYLLIDNRSHGGLLNTSSPNTTDPDLTGILSWISEEGWTRVNTGISPEGQADFTGVDEGRDGSINQFYSIYAKSGTTVDIRQHGIAGGNNYSVVIAPGTIVTNANDSGPGSLRQAIGDSRDGASILFDPAVFDGGPEDVIKLSSALPTGHKELRIDAGNISGGVTLDGQDVTRINENIGSLPTTFMGLHFRNGFAGFGGAMLNLGQAQMSLHHCTFSENSTPGGSGGAIDNRGPLIATNCSFYKNSANFAGAIINTDLLTLRHCTLSQNTGVLCCGGLVTRSTTLLENTIIAGNFGSPGADINLETTLDNFAATGCLIGTNNGCSEAFPEGLPNAGGNFAGTDVSLLDPQLTTPGQNGGMGNTMLPRPDSLAIDHGSTTGVAVLQDQTGRLRTQGNGPDIGSVEMNWGAGITSSAPVGFGSFEDVTRPGDPIQALPPGSSSPDGEAAPNAIDDDPNTKYLNFSQLNTGFDVTPIVATELVGFSITSANDFPARDPSTVLLFGIHSNGSTELIASAEIPVFSERFARQEFFFDSAAKPYSAYRVLFPTVQNSTGNPFHDSMQIAEFQLLGAPVDRSFRVVRSSVLPSTQPGFDKQITVTLVGSPGAQYDLEFSDTLTDDWFRYGVNVVASPGFIKTIVFSDPLTGKRFHRIIQRNVDAP